MSQIGGAARNVSQAPEQAEQKEGQDEEGEVEDMRDEEEEEEEARRPKVRKAPRGPTHKEREEHEATHLPYRAWCEHCVRGRGVRKPHIGNKEESGEDMEVKVPRIVMNYHFMSTEDEKNWKNPVLGIKDENTGNRYMRAVGKK